MQKNLETCDIKKLIESIEYPPILVSFFEDNKEAIINDWVDYPTIDEIREKLHLSKQEYKSSVATKVVEYFFTLLYGKNAPGDCPVMREVVNNFYDHGLKVEDVFSNCIAFKNVVIKNMIRSKTDILDYLDNTVLVLDYNLKNVLSMYSEKINSHEQRLKEKANIIEDNVLYSKTDTKGRITKVTDAFARLTGYTKKELLGKSHTMLRDPDVDSNIYKEMWDTIKTGQEWRGSFSNIKKNGNKYIANIKVIPIFDNDNKIVEYIAFRYDITAAELAKLDPLTKLQNRSSFESSFSTYAKDAKLKKIPLSILIVDIDHFKSINDTFGHLVGDDTLIKFADILKKSTRSNDVCSRWGGEEFAILLPNSDLGTAYKIAERIRLSSEKNLIINNERVVTCSIGVAQIESGEGYEKLFKRVDKYLYKAKFSGRNQTVKE